MEYKTLINFSISDFNSTIETKDLIIKKLSDKEIFELHGAEFIFDENRNIVEIKNIKKEAILSRTRMNSLLGSIESLKLASSNFLIETQSLQTVNSFLSSLYLYKLGYFIAPLTFSNDWMNIHFNYPQRIKGEEKYSITLKDLEQVLEIKSIIESGLDKKNQLNMERYIGALNQHSTPENSFINLVGVLESLLINNDSNELSFRFSIYLYHILKNILKSNLNLSIKDIKDFYTIRSHFAHTGASNKYDSNKHSILMEATRQTLVYYLKNIDFNIENSFLEKLSS